MFLFNLLMNIISCNVHIIKTTDPINVNQKAN
jgi:hypothetical protein